MVGGRSYWSIANIGVENDETNLVIPERLR
jgi:hypothetical protein